MRQQFTQKERDNETGLDYFGARYYASTQGRFTSADSFGGRITNPQTLNLYSYVRNNPLKYVDPTGHQAQDPCKDSGNPTCGQKQPKHRDDFVDENGNDVIVVTKDQKKDEPVNPEPQGWLAWIWWSLTLSPKNSPYWNRPGVEHERNRFFVMATAAGGATALIPGDEGLLAESDLVTVEDVLIESEAGTIRNVNPTGSSENCVNCAVATDATLAGRPASAMQGSVTPVSTLEQMFGGKFAPVSSPMEIEQQLLNAGNGSRGIVFGSRGLGQVGHTFNAVNQGGTVRFLDGQTGEQASFNGYTGLFFLRTH